jgi:hypothetical protein
LIGFLLLHRIETTDRHPGLMLATLGAVILICCVLEGMLP